MKILMIAPGGVHHSGTHAVIPVFLELIKRIAGRHELTVVALRQYPHFRRYALNGAQVINLGFRVYLPGSVNFLWNWRRLKAWLRLNHGGYDLIHAFWLNQPGALALLAGSRFRMPFIASLGGGETVWLPEIGYGGAGSAIRRFQIHRVLRSADVVTAGSRYALETLGGRRPDALWVPLFPDTGPFRNLGRPEDGPPWRLLQVASVNKVKDPETCLKALGMIVDRYQDTVLDWVGVDTLKGSIQALAEDMGLEKNIRFHGQVTYEAVPDFYRRAHVYIQSSIYESQGLSVCEAAAAGLPVAGTGMGLLRELSPDRTVAVKAGDASALAHAVLNLLSDPSRRFALGEKARTWMKTYHAGWTAEKFLSIYENLVSGRNPGDQGDK